MVDYFSFFKACWYESWTTEYRPFVSFSIFKKLFYLWTKIFVFLMLFPKKRLFTAYNLLNFQEIFKNSTFWFILMKLFWLNSFTLSENDLKTWFLLDFRIFKSRGEMFDLIKRAYNGEEPDIAVLQREARKGYR